MNGNEQIIKDAHKYTFIDNFNSDRVHLIVPNNNILHSYLNLSIISKRGLKQRRQVHLQYLGRENLLDLKIGCSLGVEGVGTFENF